MLLYYTSAMRGHPVGEPDDDDDEWNGSSIEQQSCCSSTDALAGPTACIYGSIGKVFWQ